MSTFILVLAVFFLGMTIPAYFWPHRLGFIAYGWRENKILCAAAWALVGSQLWCLYGLLLAHEHYGWNTFSIAIAVLNSAVIAWGSYVHWQLQKPRFKDPIDHLIYLLKKHSRKLPEHQKRARHEEIRRGALKEIDLIMQALDIEKPENLTELKLRLAIRKSLWEEIAETHPELFPPKLRP